MNQNNLTFKTGTGTMMYNTANQLTSRIDTNAHTHTYQYDANSNQLSSTSNANNSNRAITYTTFNKTKRLTTQTPNGFEINEISYDANNKRIIQKAYYDTNTTANNPNKTTYHINKGYAVIYTTDNQNNDVTIHRHNIFVNGKVVATYDKTLVNNAKAVDQAAYMHTDALGNIVTVTGNDGEVRLRQATTPFGETIAQGLINNTATGHFQKDDLRGYTGHEQLPRHSIINMNARLYDPLTARFLSADSLIPNSKDPLAYNRYLYVRNNPLKYTDPTGHYWQIAVAIALMTISATTDDPTTAKVTAIAGMLLMGGALAGQGGAGLSAAESGAVVGFTQGTLNSANLGEGVKQGVISGITAAAVNEIAHGGANGTSEFSDLEQLALQGLVGGISTELRGGKFQDGFVSAFISKGLEITEVLKGMPIEQQGAITMLAGGLASKAGGGSFEDGAMSAGFVFLYNYMFESSVTKEKHYYRIQGTICKTSTAGCNDALANKVFANVNKNDVPFTNNDRAGRHNLLGGIAPIKHTKQVSERLSVNEAIKWHPFSGGFVTHKVYFENNTLYYDVIGVGKGGSNGWLNNKLAEPSFGQGVLDVENMFGR